MRAAWVVGLVVAGVFLMSGGGAVGQDWPQWRGPNRDAKAGGFEAPAIWPKELTKKWSVTVGDDERGDVVGHGTACAGIVRMLAPGARLHSVRVLGEGNSGAGDLILAGLRHAIEAGHRVINLSLSTTKRRFAEELHELADDAYFRGTVIVASAHNLPVDSYPWRFSSVISVGSHERRDPLAWFANPEPPVELFARGVDVDVAWLGGATLRCTGNSFAAPHVAGIAALVLAKHPELTPYQVKTVLRLTATNAEGTP